MGVRSKTQLRRLIKTPCNAIHRNKGYKIMSAKRAKGVVVYVNSLNAWSTVKLPRVTLPK